jgi:hypothetical protein
MAPSVCVRACARARVCVCERERERENRTQSSFLCQSMFLLADARFSAYQLYYEEINFYFILNLII